MNRNKIVVIEDEPDIVEVVSYNLKREGFNVLSVERGDEGLNLVRNQSPNLVILDLMLPGMDVLMLGTGGTGQTKCFRSDFKL